MNATQKNTASSWKQGLLTLLTVLAAWIATAALVQLCRGVSFPWPWDVAGRLVKLLSGQTLYSHAIGTHLLSSLWRWGLGYTLAVIVGLSMGLLLGLSSNLSRLLTPIFTLIHMIPGLAWIPIALLVFGIGTTATTFMIFIMAVIPIVINTAAGIQTVPPVQIEAAQIMGANRKALFLRVLFPAALQSILTGLRLGMAGAWRVLIAAEMVVGLGVGLGYIIIQSRWSLDYEASFVALGLILLMGLLFEKLFFTALERRVAPAFPSTERTMH